MNETEHTNKYEYTNIISKQIDMRSYLLVNENEKTLNHQLTKQVRRNH